MKVVIVTEKLETINGYVFVFFYSVLRDLILKSINIMINYGLAEHLQNQNVSRI